MLPYSTKFGGERGKELKKTHSPRFILLPVPLKPILYCLQELIQGGSVSWMTIDSESGKLGVCVVGSHTGRGIWERVKVDGDIGGYAELLPKKCFGVGDLIFLISGGFNMRYEGRTKGGGQRRVGMCSWDPRKAQAGK